MIIFSNATKSNSLNGSFCSETTKYISCLLKISSFIMYSTYLVFFLFWHKYWYLVIISGLYSVIFFSILKSCVSELLGKKQVPSALYKPTGFPSMVLIKKRILSMDSLESITFSKILLKLSCVILKYFSFAVSISHNWSTIYLIISQKYRFSGISITDKWCSCENSIKISNNLFRCSVLWQHFTINPLICFLSNSFKWYKKASSSVAS